ncbi:class I SAM-dependent methyltransferase [Campylobacter concisus]|uniref:class I SAM-dependent methyltransferase n=1 Tax=Campylobacter concisus TaxID=199 RepID=UPI0031BAF238
MQDIINLGQVPTPFHIVTDMMSLMKNSGSILEPSCGDGAFLNQLPKHAIGIEIDSNVIKNENAKNLDFFSFDVKEKFDTIIGNPPYVRYQDINANTKTLLNKYDLLFDKRSNLYLFFIYKAILHLNDGGELIFITPRDFLKLTSSAKLNKFMFENGTITDFIDLGDMKIFSNAQPNCAIWRFEKNNFKRNTNVLKNFLYTNGQLLFTTNEYPVKFNDLFFVKVGAVSGYDKAFVNEKASSEFVCSTTVKDGKTRKMFYNIYDEALLKYKDRLIKRKIKKFDETNWFMWGRNYYQSDNARIYVNCKTRNKKPFFTHKCKAYDGSVLAIFPKFTCDIDEVCEMLNKVDWNELGFVCDGRFYFHKRA